MIDSNMPPALGNSCWPEGYMQKVGLLQARSVGRFPSQLSFETTSTPRHWKNAPRMSRMNHDDKANDFAGHEVNGNGRAGMPTLEQVRTQGSFMITPEMFERMYLAPQNQVTGSLRTTVGNPTPIGLGGFLIGYCPIIFSILGFRGFTGNGAATVGTYFFSGGMLAILACIMEWIIGNTFPAVFFGVFGGYFLSFGATLVPSFNAYGAYATDPSNLETGKAAPGFLSGIGR